MRLRHAVAPAAVVLALLPAAGAEARPLTCSSADLRYPFEAGGPKTFGVFHLRIRAGQCPTAHRVAKAWMDKFEASLRKPGPLKLPRTAGGFRFVSLPPTAAQTYR